MRGADVEQTQLFSYVSLESRIPQEHPLRRIRVLVDEAFATLESDFGQLYAATGRPSIPPEKLLRALLLQAFYTIRSERQLMEQLDYNLLFRWFVGLSMDDRVWHPTTFTKNRDRLLDGEIATRFLTALLNLPKVRELLSDEHFSVDGTLIDAWASMKSVRPKDDHDDTPRGGGRNPDVDFRGQRRRNDTHGSTTDPQARLFRKGRGKPAQLCYVGHALMENRNRLIVDTRLTQANGRCEREAALEMIREIPAGRRLTLGADAGYNTREFVAGLRECEVTPHVAGRKHSAVDGRTTRHPGYPVSQRIRKQIEEFFGWGKSVGGLAKSRFIGPRRLSWQFTLSATAYNLIRLPKLMEAG